MQPNITLDQINKNSKYKLIASVVVGNTLEYIDFITFIFLAPIIADLFFPKQHPELATMLTYTTIVITYLFRPIGGIIFGNIGDKYGRKTVLGFTILLMAIPSFIIGILPTFKEIGYFAPAILILMRILQGCSIGGEVPGSITYVVENFRHKNYMLHCAMLTCGANIGIVVGSQVVSFLINHTSPVFIYTIGWRIPFLGGGLLAIIGFYIRIFLTESEEFINLRATKKISKVPFFALLKDFNSEIISGILLCMIVSLTTSIFHVFLPGLLVKHYSFRLAAATNFSSIGAATMAIFSLFFAWITKYIAPIKITYIAVIGLISLLLVILIFGDNLRLEEKNLAHLYGVVFICGILIAGINGLFFGLLADLFPTNVRYSGISACYNIAYILGASSTPLWASELIIISESSYKYIIAVCFIFLLVFTSLFKPQTGISVR
ncbi:MAG: MFS transporter [Burkholderiales bacterium]|nr:MFS transporter [Burkholderiales bacterium]